LLGLNDADGDREGLDEGLNDADGERLGLPEGLIDGELLGLRDGLSDGLLEGLQEGLPDGDFEGLSEDDGESEGLCDGLIDGLGPAMGLSSWKELEFVKKMVNHLLFPTNLIVSLPECFVRREYRLFRKSIRRIPIPPKILTMFVDIEVNIPRLHVPENFPDQEVPLLILTQVLLHGPEPSVSRGLQIIHGS
jgi:hypothetical protein